MSSFFEELKRRKVYRVAVGYLVAGWLIIQVSATIFPVLGLPDLAERFVVSVVLIGFPLALFLAWAFDVTPQGIQATPSLPLHSEVASRHRRRNIGLLIGSGVLISGVAGFFLLPRAGATKMEKSIAVLPFENFSGKAENAYFADGIQDDILTNLSKIGDLKVISRTSVMAYRGNKERPPNRKGAWSLGDSRGECSTRRRSRAGECAINQRDQRSPHLGGRLRSRI
mgnify:CR=1 FL=1